MGFLSVQGFQDLQSAAPVQVESYGREDVDFGLTASVRSLLHFLLR